MKKNIVLSAACFVILAVSGGCVSQQPVTVPDKGTYESKVSRYIWMQSNWSYLNNDWIVGDKVTPKMLQTYYFIPENQATSEVLEFKKIQRHYSGFQRFMASIYLLNVRYYINY